MANKTKAENAKALAEAGIPQRSFSPDQFCARQNISGTMYRELKKRGIGPREIRVLDRVLITIEAEDAWLAARAAKNTPA